MISDSAPLGESRIQKLWQTVFNKIKISNVLAYFTDIYPLTLPTIEKKTTPPKTNATIHKDFHLEIATTQAVHLIKPPEKHDTPFQPCPRFPHTPSEIELHYPTLFKSNKRAGLAVVLEPLPKDVRFQSQIKRCDLKN